MGLTDRCIAERSLVISDDDVMGAVVSETLLVKENAAIGGGYWRMVLDAPSMSQSSKAGQFVMISLPEASSAVLPRPMAIHRRRPRRAEVEVVYGAVGRGTRSLTVVEPGEGLLVTGPLGRGFRLPPRAGPVLLMGRGIGVCSFMTLAEDATAANREVVAVLSARSRDRVIGLGDSEELGLTDLVVVDEEGNSDEASVIASVLDMFRVSSPAGIYVCGSNRMARWALALGKRWDAEVQISLEEHMACGIGYCHGCAIGQSNGGTREGLLACQDGPVFRLE